MKDDTKMHALFEALADSVDDLSEEEVLAECIEDGQSPADVATRTRSVLLNAAKGWAVGKDRQKAKDATGENFS